jgi:hypothetical protein
VIARRAAPRLSDTPGAAQRVPLGIRSQQGEMPMKKFALTAAVVLACAAPVFAASSSATTQSADSSMNTQQADTQSSAGSKMRNGAHKVGQAIRNAGHKVADGVRHIAHPHRDQQARNDSDTRAMGAAGDDAQDSGRRARMDSAYANWQAKQSRQQDKR